MSGSRRAQASRIAGAAPGDIEAHFPAIRYRRVQPVSFGPVSVCQAAAFVLGDSLQMDHSCTEDGGAVSIFYPGTDGRALFAMFRAAVLDAGGQVAFSEAGAVGVTGGTGAVAAVFGEADPTARTRTVQGATAFTVPNPPDDLMTLEGSGGSLSTGVLFRRLPNGVSPAELSSASREVGVSARIVRLGGEEFAVFQSPADADSVFAVVGGLEDVSLDISTQQVGSEELVDFRQSHPNVSVVSTPLGLRITGSPYSANVAARAAIRHFPALSDYRIEAAFLAFDRGQEQEFAVQLGLDLARNTASGVVSVVAGAADGSALSAVVDQARARYSATVVSRPSLTASSGETGRFVSGQSVPLLSVSEDDDSQVSTYTYRDVGVVLGAVPVALPDGRVRVQLQLELSSLSDAQGVGGNPLVNTQSLSTSVTVYPGDLVVLSGLTYGERSASRSRSVFRPSTWDRETERQLQILLTVAPDA